MGQRKGSPEAAQGPKSAGLELPHTQALSGLLDAERWLDGGWGTAGGWGEGVSPRDSGLCKFPSSALQGAVPVQGPLGLVRRGSAVAMAMGEGGVGGHLKVGFCA